MSKHGLDTTWDTANAIEKTKKDDVCQINHEVKPYSLEVVKGAWLMGDWERLTSCPIGEMQDMENREIHALMAGAAYMQLGDVKLGRLCVSQAREWGCSKHLIAKVLTTGVYFTLGRAEFLNNQRLKSQNHVITALRSFSNDNEALIPTVDLDNISAVLGTSLLPPPLSMHGFIDWVMERDDAPILRYLFKVHQPKRHLEFGTWQGLGACLCLEETNATVWTINLHDGETKPDGSWAYGERVLNEQVPNDPVSMNFGEDDKGPIVYHRTDAGSYIGWMYRQKGYGHRVCQIYCDSRQWDASNYPPDFFDSVFVDGGHQSDVVISDTRKALSVLRTGGMIIWHDFCPDTEVATYNPVAKEVTLILQALLAEIGGMFSHLGWINPSMILMGIKK